MHVVFWSYQTCQAEVFVDKLEVLQRRRRLTLFWNCLNALNRSVTYIKHELRMENYKFIIFTRQARVYIYTQQEISYHYKKVSTWRVIKLVWRKTHQFVNTLRDHYKMHCLGLIVYATQPLPSKFCWIPTVRVCSISLCIFTRSIKSA